MSELDIYYIQVHILFIIDYYYNITPSSVKIHFTEVQSTEFVFI